MIAPSGRSPTRHSRSWSTASARRSARGTSSFRAPGAASPGVEKLLPEFAELGLRRALPAADPPDRAHPPQGPQQRAGRAPRRPGQPVGHRRASAAGTRRSTPSSARARDFDALVGAARASSGSRSRSTSRSSALPTIPGCASTPTGSTAGPTARSSTPRTRPSATRTSTTSTSTPRTGASSGMRCATSCCTGSAQGVQVFRVDNPHTKPIAFWEWLIAEVQRTHPDDGLPGRGVHAAGDDGVAGQGRLQPVLHVLHVAKHEGRADRVHDRADALGAAAVLPAELLRQHARHPPRLPAAKAAGRRSRRGSCWRRRSRPPTGIYSGFERCETRAAEPRPARSISTRRSTSSRSARLTGRCCR